MRPQLHPQRAPERFDARLGRAVRRQPGGRQDRRGGCDQQQVPAAGEHVWQRGVDGAPDAEQVDVDRVLERLRRDHPQRAAGRDPGVGHRDVDAAEALPEVVDRRGQRFRVAHVGDRGLRARHDRVEPLGVEVDQPEAHAAGRQLARELGTDARRAAGDERHAPLEVPGHRHGTLNGGVEIVTR